MSPVGTHVVCWLAEAVTGIVVVAIGRVAADGEIGAYEDVMAWLKRGRLECRQGCRRVC
ncbi:hypothetical protein IG631_08491 [Alternaria alternata]|nr:hypothetical protein IG631_08491 [Alternaria alternata]